ncbi:MAG: hypothetical protein WCF84_02350 [Anaerolineae bacterium]
MAFTLQITQSGSTLVNLIDGTNYATVSFKRGLQRDALDLVRSQWQGDILGASASAVLQNLIALHRVMLAAQDNLQRAQAGYAYAPIWLQLQLPNAGTLAQAELFADDKVIKNLDKLLETSFLGNVLEDAQIDLYHRDYFEETAAVVLQNAQTFSNNGASIDIPNTLRGDLPAPLQIKVRAGSAGITRLTAALKAPATGTVANFTAMLEAESGVLGTNVALVADATLSPGSGNSGAQWTPGTTNEQGLVGIAMTTNLLDQQGKLRLLVAVVEQAVAANVKLRARLGIYSGSYSSIGSAQAYGAWGDATKFAATMGTRVLVDCGILDNPPLDTFGQAVQGICLELWGTATVKGQISPNTTITNQGSGYTNGTYALGFAGGGGTGAAGTYTVTGNKVTSITITNGGQNYTSAPTLSFPSGGGSSAAATAALATYTLDNVYLLPCYEGGRESGYFTATLPLALGSGAAPDGVLDANDRVARAYELDNSGNLLFAAQDLRGDGALLAWPGRAQKLVVLASIAASSAQAWNNNNTVTVSYTPRYRIARGT